MSLESSGKLLEIFDEQQVSEKFKKREFVLEIPDGNYPQQVKFQLSQDKCSLLDQFKVGQEIKVQFNLQGKPFTKNGTTMYFTNLGAWRLEATNSGSAPSGSPAAAAKQNYTVEEDANSDLPF